MATSVVIDLEHLAALHAERPLLLTTADRAGFVFDETANPADEGPPAATLAAGHAFVSELLRLARLGHAAEQALGGR